MNTKPIKHELTELPDGNWRVQVWLPSTNNGPTIDKVVKTKAAAKAALHKVKAEYGRKVAREERAREVEARRFLADVMRLRDLLEECCTIEQQLHCRYRDMPDDVHARLIDIMETDAAPERTRAVDVEDWIARLIEKG